MRKTIISAVCGVLMTAGVANAAPYGTAGCGLGSVLLGDEPGAVQILASTLNFIVGNQTFGITTGTLGCGEASLKGIKGSTKIYIEGNREVLAKDIARGQGDTIVGLSAIAGCQDTAQVGTLLQSKYEVIFPAAQASSDHVTDAIIDALRAEPSLACKQLI